MKSDEHEIQRGYFGVYKQKAMSKVSVFSLLYGSAFSSEQRNFIIFGWSVSATLLELIVVVSWYAMLRHNERDLPHSMNIWELYGFTSATDNNNRRVLL